MSRFVVSHINWFNNDLTSEVVEANNEAEARWKHSKLQHPDNQKNMQETMDMNTEEFKSWCFDYDMAVVVIAV